MINHNKGFTLVELLVVIAIIGVLASVILPKMGTARQKGGASAFKMEMDNFRKAAEVFYSNSYTYNGLFATTTASLEVDPTADESVQSLLSSLISKSANATLYGSISDNDYVLYGRLPGVDPVSSTSTDIWCVDSKGKSDFPSADAVDQFTTAPATECW